MDVTLWIIGAFACYRLARDLVYEEGPFLLYAKLQAWAEQGPQNWLRKGLQCPMCLSFWLAFLVALALAPESIPLFMIIWFGIAGGSAFLIRLTG